MDSVYYLFNSYKKDKKYCIVTPNGKIIHFGAFGYSDFTLNKNNIKKNMYIVRHKKRENWNKTGINTSGFWSRWMLWEKPTLYSAIRNMEQKFNIDIVI
jgi:hypothetical protein